MLLASMLQAQGLSWRIASAVVRETWLEWLPALAAIEGHSQPDEIAPASRQWFLGVAVAVGRPPVTTVQVGMDATYDALTELKAREGGAWRLPPVGVSISAALHALRANERMTGVALPARFTVAQDDPVFERFMFEALAYRKASDARLRAKARVSKNARRSLREMEAIA